MDLRQNDSANDFTGSVAIVTGGGRGLGRAFAQALSTAGAKVAVTARSEVEVNETVKLIRAGGGTALYFVADVTDRTAMERVMVQIEEQLGPIDLLINNAAVQDPIGLDWEVDLDAWWRTMEINLRGAYLCARLVLPGMMTRRRGRIINISSSAAYNLFPYVSAYCISKAALTQMTNLLASGLKDHGIKVFALAPYAPTAMLEMLAVSPNVPEAVNLQFRDFYDAADEPMEKSVRVLMFLASGRADRLTGRHISHDDSIDDILYRTDEILRDDLYTLKLRV